MAYFLFIDESGQDHHDSPYEVLAGVTIKDEDLWNLIKTIHDLEITCFGKRYRNDKNEIKARSFLKRKTFRLANQLPPIPLITRTEHARKALDPNLPVTKLGLTALAQAKLDYAKQIFELCIRFRCKIFASIIADPDTIPSDRNMLRKDYVYLFERFYYFLEDKNEQPQGIVVFDELDKTASHLVLSQMDRYFKSTLKGRTRSALIIPEPFFVHSDLTTGIQIVDFIAYIISWNFRAGKLVKDCRGELDSYLELVKSMRYITSREIGDIQKCTVWSIAVV
ncbi:DUF3800 domain-containing protein [Pedobacter nutrimenti]|uniref:DUF3800 domain-containing protein n=1 Tax=Pedobacter nutrimenti TaxID=1241337 RepID=UPI002930D41B|nr:DUF3800 domain-containing protein [Pedobacter nutrimenti]